jgi:hypothetical protein
MLLFFRASSPVLGPNQAPVGLVPPGLKRRVKLNAYLLYLVWRLRMHRATRCLIKHGGNFTFSLALSFYFCFRVFLSVPRTIEMSVILVCRKSICSREHTHTQSNWSRLFYKPQNTIAIIFEYEFCLMM